MGKLPVSNCLDDECDNFSMVTHFSGPGGLQNQDARVCVSRI